MNVINNAKKYSNESISLVYRPKILDIKITDQKKELLEILKNNESEVNVNDNIESQLRELIKIRNPSKRIFSEEDYVSAISNVLNGTEIEDYGLWIYYPWSKNLVHIVNEKEFIELRTSRNKYKITEEEQQKLSKQKIGIIGLSVGQSIALTLAMERGCGELRLTDFDTLELTNLNRIRTGIHNIGIHKTIIAAREIAEIDPFLNVLCFSGGLNEENIDDFLMKGGKLDILVEECDGIDVKILARIKAKEYGIPVVMDTSDRGMIDIERFDLEPNRPILHGLIGNINSESLSSLTAKDKLVYLAAMVGVETMSSRIKASALEVGQTITTWPQLASSVILGGAVSGDVCRRICLNQLTISGRFYVDLEEIIEEPKTIESKKQMVYPALTKETMISLVKNLEFEPHPNRINLTENQLNSIIDAARLAPSGGNSQPWRFLYKNKQLHLFFDKSASTSFLDFDDTSSLISLGACIENLVLKAHQINLEVEINYHDFSKERKLLASFVFFDNSVSNARLEPKKFDSLVYQIEKRNTNRQNSNKSELTESDLNDFNKIVADCKNAKLQFEISKEKIKSIGEIISACDRIRLLHSQSHFDFINKEMRWNKNESIQKNDGINITELELNPWELETIRIIKDYTAIQMLGEWDLGNSFKEISKENIKSSYAIGLITMDGYSAQNHIEGGRVAQRIWLLATEKNIGFHPMCVPLTFFSRLLHGNPKDFGEKYSDEIKLERKKFESLFETGKDFSEIFLFRIFKANPTNTKTIRQPISTILNIG